MATDRQELQIRLDIQRAQQAGDERAELNARMALRDLLQPTYEQAFESDPESLINPEAVEAIGEDDATLAEQALGAGETALTLATGATGGTVGMMGMFLKGLADELVSGEFGTPEAATRIERQAMEGMEALTYTPRTEAGREALQTTGEALAPLTAVAPLSGQMQAFGAAGKAAKALPKRSELLRETIKPAEKANIPVMTSDVFPPKTFVGKLGQTVTERIPFIGTGKVRADQQAQRTAAIKNLLVDYGATETAQAIDDVAANLIAKRGKQLNRYSTMKGEVIDRLSAKGNVPVSKALTAIDDEIGKLQSLKTESVAPAIRLLEDFKASIQNQNISNIELLRRQLGEQLKDPGLASIRTTAEKSTSKIYNAIRQDMGDFIKKTGERNDFKKWSIANQRLKTMINELDNTALKSVINTGNITPENARKLLFSRKPSDIKTLYKGLTQEGKRSARIAVLQEALAKVGGIDQMTPENFRRQLKQLSKSTGVFFTGKDAKALDGLTRAIDLTRQAGVAGVKPITGAEVTAFASPTALTYLLGGDPVLGATATAGVGAIGRLFESSKVRNLLINMSNASRDKVLESIPALVAAIQPLVQASDNEETD